MDHLKINAKDNVAVALAPLKTGEERLGVVLKEDIKSGHKFALRAIAEGENVIILETADGARAVRRIVRSTR